MSKKLGWRGAIIAVLIVVALVYLTPSLSGELPGWWYSILPQDKIQLGLDLCSRPRRGHVESPLAFSSQSGSPSHPVGSKISFIPINNGSGIPWHGAGTAVTSPAR